VKSGDVFADYILSLPAAQTAKTAAYPSLDDRSRRRSSTTCGLDRAAGIRTVYNKIYPARPRISCRS